VTIKLTYDHDGNRVGKQVQTGSTYLNTYYLVDDKNPSGYAQVLVEYQDTAATPSAANEAFYISYIQGQNVLWQHTASGATYYYGYDGQGSVRGIMNTSGSIVKTYSYDAWGTMLAPTTSPIDDRYLYTGQQWDKDLGMYYLRARYYSPQYGRFWTMDSYEGSQSDPASLHKYLYCASDPLNNIDPSGRDLISTMVSIGSRAILYSAVGAAIGGLAGGVDAIIDWNPNRHFSDGFKQGAIIGGIAGATWTFKIARPVLSILGAALGGWGVGEALDDGQSTLAMYRGALLGAGILLGSPGQPRLTSIQEIGDVGEARAIAFLKKNGHMDIICVKNAAKNGLDIISRTPEGRLHFVEVKASASGKVGDLSNAQQDMDPYVRNILELASEGRGRFKSVDAATKQAAERLLREYNADPARVSGTVVGVDLQNDRINVSPWPGRPDVMPNGKK
jgi:RHS repeat-associated protein